MRLHYLTDTINGHSIVDRITARRPSGTLVTLYVLQCNACGKRRNHDNLAEFKKRGSKCQKCKGDRHYPVEYNI